MNSLPESQSIPLVLALADEPDFRGYDDAIRLHKLVSDSYDPESQTSLIPAHAGTSLTYCNSGTGNVFNSDTDQKSDDT